MREENKIRDKYRQLKYQHLKKIFEKNLSKTPENCIYNKVIILPNRYKVNICIFDLEKTVEVDLCFKTEHSKDCNAFCPLKNKEELRDIFQKEIENDQIRATKYKDLNALLWILPSLEEKLPSKGFWSKIQNFFSKIIN